MVHITVTSLIGRDITTRSLAHCLLSVLHTYDDECIVLDFHGVYFVSVDFMDTFYTDILKPLNNRITVIGMLEDIQELLEARRRQHTED